MPTAPDSHRPSQTVPAGAPATLAEVLARIERDGPLPEHRRKSYAGAIRTICAILGRPPEAVPGAMAQIEALLGDVPAPARGRSTKTIANARSMLKAALLHYSAHAKVPPRGTALSPEWGELHGRLVDPRMKNGLSRLMRVASFQGVRPIDMSDGAFDRVLDVVKTVNWGRDTVPFHRKVVDLWNEAVDTIPGWPRTYLTPPAVANRVSHLPISAFPLSFQQDVAGYLAWAGGGDPLAVEAPKRPLKATTLKLRQHQLRIGASTLAHQLGDPEHIRTLADLVRPANVKLVLTAFLPTSADFRSSAFVRGLGMTCKSVARDWVKASAADLDELARMQSRLPGEQNGLTKKNRAVMRQLEDPRLLDTLLALPDIMRAEAATRRMSPSRRLQKIQIALVIDILLVAPIRLQNLASLRLDHQLQWPGGRTGTLYITLNDDETKNEQPLEYPLPNRIREAVIDYLDRYRGQGKIAKSSWLFVRGDGAPVPAGTLRDGIKKATERALGFPVTPHQFRHLAAAITLDALPGALGLVKDLLGHKSLKTTQNFYAGMRTRQAGRAYDQILSSRVVTDAGTR